MAETKIIPLDLRALICSHLLSKYNKSYLEYFQMAPYDKSSLAGVAPLDIPDVRKTQRRVAALLGKDPADLFPSKSSHRYRHATPPYTDSEVHSIRRLLGPGSKKAHRQPVQVPLAPQNSWLGLIDGHHDDNGEADGAGDEGNLFNTSIFHDTTDPNSFRLPSVFAGSSTPGGTIEGWSQHDRVVPTVSERTFVNSNLRHDAYSTPRGDGSRVNGHQHTPLHGTATPPSPPSSSSPFLPYLDPQQRDLVSMNGGGSQEISIMTVNTVNEKSEGNQRTGSKSKEDITKDEMEMMSSMVRMMSLESELTRAGSLLMDDNFVPMSVTITKLSHDTDDTCQADVSKNTESGPAAGRLTEKVRVSKSKTNNGGFSKINKTEISGHCTCKEPRPLLIPSTSPCPCCLRLGGQHETGCPQKGSHLSKKRGANLSCNLCGKPIIHRRRREKDNKRQKDIITRTFSGSEHTRNPTTPETAINIFQSQGSADLRCRQKCSSRNGSDHVDIEGRSSKPTSTNPATSDHRVRFDENVLTRHIYSDEEIGENDLPEKEDNNIETQQEGGDVKTLKKSKDKKLFVKRKDFGFPKIGQSVNVPNLGVSVHAIAYDLALKDARIEADMRNKKRRAKGTQSNEVGGTMFSYFPSLKRPFSESDRPDIGVKAQDGRKVTGKSYKNMRHIFGKVKIADYYPGGKKWRKP